MCVCVCVCWRKIKASIMHFANARVFKVFVWQMFSIQKSVLETFEVGPNSLFALLKERFGCDLKRLKNRLQIEEEALQERLYHQAPIYFLRAL